MKNIAMLAPVIGRVLQIIDMKNRDVELYIIIFWFLICNFVGAIVFKVFVKKELVLEEDEFVEILGSIFVLSIGKAYGLNDYLVGGMVLVLYAYLKRNLVKCSGMKTTNKISNKMSKKVGKDSEDNENDEDVTAESRSEATTPRRRGRPRKVSSDEEEKKTPRRKSARKLNFEED